MIKKSVSSTKNLFIIEFFLIIITAIVLSQIQSSKVMPFVASSLFATINLFLVVIFVHGMINLHGPIKGLIVFMGMIKYLFMGLGVYLLIKFFKQDYEWLVLGFSTIFLSIILFSILKVIFNEKPKSIIGEGA